MYFNITCWIIITLKITYLNGCSVPLGPFFKTHYSYFTHSVNIHTIFKNWLLSFSSYSDKNLFSQIYVSFCRKKNIKQKSPHNSYHFPSITSVRKSCREIPWNVGKNSTKKPSSNSIQMPFRAKKNCFPILLFRLI